jgi:ubiquinol-cytochrome c reductase iron-sulfur subunit
MRVVKTVAGRLWRYLVAAATVLFARRRRARKPDEEDLVRRDAEPSHRSEHLAAGLLVAAALAAVWFVVAYVAALDTQLLGLGIGMALLFCAGAAIVAGKSVVPQEEREEERPGFAYPGGGNRDAASELSDTVLSAGEGISRRRLLGVAAGAAGTALGVAVVVPLASLGPSVGDRLRASPWRAGVRLVDEHGSLVPASDLATGSFLTAFADGADPEDLASSVVVVRVNPDDLELPADRADWAPSGIIAFSKICTHAGCAVNLFRTPLYPPQQPGPALVCPCHYSTFDVLEAGKVVFGPAGRPLPQLPLSVDRAGHLVAAGPLSGNVGPAWPGVRES